MYQRVIFLTSCSLKMTTPVQQFWLEFYGLMRLEIVITRLILNAAHCFFLGATEDALH